MWCSRRWRPRWACCRRSGRDSPGSGPAETERGAEAPGFSTAAAPSGPCRGRQYKEAIGMDEPRDFLSGLIVGSLMGVALGLLFAPEAGERTRERVRKQSKEWSTRARERADQVAEQVRTKAGDVAERVRDGADEFAARARDAAGDALQRARTVVEEKTDRLRRAYQDGRDSAGWSHDRGRKTPESPEA